MDLFVSFCLRYSGVDALLSNVPVYFCLPIRVVGAHQLPCIKPNIFNSLILEKGRYNFCGKDLTKANHLIVNKIIMVHGFLVQDFFDFVQAIFCFRMDGMVT